MFEAVVSQRLRPALVIIIEEYVGELVEWAAALLCITLRIVKRPSNQKGLHPADGALSGTIAPPRTAIHAQNRRIKLIAARCAAR